MSSKMKSVYCALKTGAVIFYDMFPGIQGDKGRWFIVITDQGPTFECFTTTTRPHTENPKLANEFCELVEGECCLPKTCLVDFRYVYQFDDIHLNSWLRSRRVQHKCDLSPDLLSRISNSLEKARSLAKTEKDRLRSSLAIAIPKS